MDLIKEMLQNSKNIAVIGMKDDESAAAYRIPNYLLNKGYKVFPVNPKLEGKTILETKVHSKVTDVKEKIDLVDIFRKPEFLVDHAKEILQMNPLPEYVWFQLGIYNDEAAKMLEEKGITVIQNRCIMVEHARLF